MLDKHIENWEDKLAIVEKPFTKKDLYIATNRANPNSKAIIEAFNSGLAQLKATGEFDKIVRSYNLED